MLASSKFTYIRKGPCNETRNEASNQAGNEGEGGRSRYAGRDRGCIGGVCGVLPSIDRAAPCVAWHIGAGSRSHGMVSRYDRGLRARDSGFHVLSPSQSRRCCGSYRKLLQPTELQNLSLCGGG